MTAFSRLRIVLRFVRPALSRSWVSVVIGIGVLLLDLFTGPFLQFPILFIIPVGLAAWYSSPRLAYALAVLLPFGRLLIATFLEHPFPFGYIAANCLVRIAVLVLITLLVARTARLTRELRERAKTLVTMCAGSRTIEYQGEWISFEQYLKRRFNIETSHGISDVELRKIVRTCEE
jgi:hypothetical protein